MASTTRAGARTSYTPGSATAPATWTTNVDVAVATWSGTASVAVGAEPDVIGNVASADGGGVRTSSQPPPTTTATATAVAIRRVIPNHSIHARADSRAERGGIGLGGSSDTATSSAVRRHDAGNGSGEVGAPEGSGTPRFPIPPTAQSDRSCQ